MTSNAECQPQILRESNTQQERRTKSVPKQWEREWERASTRRERKHRQHLTDTGEMRRVRRIRFHFDLPTHWDWVFFVCVAHCLNVNAKTQRLNALNYARLMRRAMKTLGKHSGNCFAPANIATWAEQSRLRQNHKQQEIGKTNDNRAGLHMYVPTYVIVCV